MRFIKHAQREQPKEHLPDGHPAHRSNRLATRLLVLFFAISVIAAAIILLIGAAISQDIADEAARRLSRQYSVEAAANFQHSTYSHFLLMQQVSYSATISRWLADEDDPQGKARAFDEIMGYARLVPDVRLMFTSYQTKRGYDFHTSLSLHEFEPWGRLAGGAVSQWFYDTRDAEVPFTLNIQRERDEEAALLVWSNHRMYYQGEFVGVVSVGSPFDQVFDAVFGGLDTNYVRGYIIDRGGTVRADSARLLAVTEYGLSTLPALPEAAENPALRDAIGHHLEQMIDGVFLPGHSFEAIPLSVGGYKYAGIAPIIGTDWSVVVLSNHTGTFGETRYQPLFFSVIAALIFSALIGGLFVYRIAFKPLSQLTQSASMASDITKESDQYGIEREDEIGVLARTVQRMRADLRTQRLELQSAAVTRMADKRTQLMLDAAPMSVFLYDDTLTSIDCNVKAVDMFGFSGKEEARSGFLEIFPPIQPDGQDSKECLDDLLRTAFRDGYACSHTLSIQRKADNTLQQRMRLVSASAVCDVELIIGRAIYVFLHELRLYHEHNTPYQAVVAC